MKKLALVAAFLCIGLGVAAQKTGHVSVAEVIAGMPAKKTAEQEIEALSKKYQADIEIKMVALQKKANQYQEKVKTASPEQLEQWNKEVQKENQDIEKMRAEAYKAIEKKRQELLNPIINKVQESINKIAKAQGINYVLDYSRGGVLVYAEGGNDITPAVKKDLGIQ